MACACSLEPRYRAPALPVPDQWPTSASSGPGIATSASNIGWRNFFTDTRLQQLLSLALSNNRDLRVAVLNIENARALYKIQRADLLPSIDASGSFTREKLPVSLTYEIPTPTFGYFDAGVSVTSYEVDLFGRVRSLTHASLEKYFARQQARRGAHLSLIAQVACAYLTLAADRESQRLALQTLQSREESFAHQKQQHETGTISGLELAQSKVTVEEARTEEARAEGNTAQDIDILTLLVGTPVDPSLLPERFDSGMLTTSPLPADIPSTILLHRPDVLEAEHTLRAANANIGAARAAFFPQITLTADLGSASYQLANLFTGGTGTWAFQPLITLPIFHGGAVKGGLDLATVNEKIALAQYEKAIQSGFREVADALAQSTALDHQRAAEENLIDATGRAYELAQRRYKRGRDSYLQVLDSQRSDFAARQRLVATRLAQDNIRVTLYKALGGGWLEYSSP